SFCWQSSSLEVNQGAKG
ncbi:unnamed protein product, partial [Allacma fusca]